MKNSPEPLMQPDMVTFRRQWGMWLLVLCLMAMAVLFRLADLNARNLWTDEAWVALAVLQPTPAQALAAGRSTPPFYLLTLWAVARVFGHSEAVLRSLSFYFGLGTVLLFWPLARTLTTRAAAVMGLTALVFSPIMVYFSKELKQYSGDAFFAVLVLLVTERLRTSQRWPGWLLLAFAGMLGIGFSHSLIFILPVSLAALWFALPAHRGRVALMALVWSGTFAALYFLIIRHQMDPELMEYWSRDFPDFSGLSAFIFWLGGAWRRYLEYFLGPNGLYWGAPLLVLGVLHLLRHQQPLACFYLSGSLLMAFAASALHRYPFMANYGGSRLMLFCAPLLYLIVATGGVAAVQFMWRHRLRWLAPFLIGGIFLALDPVPMMQENFHTTFNLSQIEPLVQHLEAKTRPGDKVYVYYYAIYPFKYYYQGNLDLVYWGKSCVETGLNLGGDNGDDNRDNGREPRRLWLIAGHYPNLAYMDAFAANLLGPHWQQMNCLTAPGAVLYRFERREAAMAKNPADLPKSALSGLPVPAPGKAYR